MPNEGWETIVVDASVAAKRWFEEPDGAIAREALARAQRLIAPDFLLIEMASIAAKRVRRGVTTNGQAERAVREVADFIDELAPSAPLARRAFELARDHGVSAYDSLYLALAEREGVIVLTADRRLVDRARAAGIGHLVTLLAA
jgi:predicted nucleic acid-binding protein